MHNIINYIILQDIIVLTLIYKSCKPICILIHVNIYIQMSLYNKLIKSIILGINVCKDWIRHVIVVQ